MILYKSLQYSGEYNYIIIQLQASSFTDIFKDSQFKIKAFINSIIFCPYTFLPLQQLFYYIGLFLLLLLLSPVTIVQQIAIGYAAIGQVIKDCIAARQATENHTIARQVTGVQMQRVFEGNTAIGQRLTQLAKV